MKVRNKERRKRKNRNRPKIFGFKTTVCLRPHTPCALWGWLFFLSFCLPLFPCIQRNTCPGICPGKCAPQEEGRGCRIAEENRGLVFTLISHRVSCGCQTLWPPPCGSPSSERSNILTCAFFFFSSPPFLSPSSFFNNRIYHDLAKKRKT